MNVVAISVIAGLVTVPLFRSDADGSEISIHNESSHPIYIGPSDVSVDTGYPIGAHGSAVVNVAAGDRLFVVAGHENLDVRVFTAARD